MADFDFGNLTLDIGTPLSSSDIDDILKIDMSSTVNIGAVGSSGGYAYTVTGANGTSNYPSWSNNWNNNWTTSTFSTGGLGVTQGTVDINADGIKMQAGTDIKIGHKSLLDFMDRVEARLGILQPNPELLEKFEALKQAYEHYKTLEALCTGNIPKDPNGK
jgi:hypothetical protein